MVQRPTAGDVISLKDAAAYAAYRSASTLRKAAREGIRRVVRKSSRVMLTMHDGIAE